MKIGIDVDEVIVDFIKHFLDYSNTKNNTSFVLEDIDDYYLWETKIHSSKEESVNEITEFQLSKDFDKIDFIEGVKDILEKIFEFSTIYFITSRPKILKEKTENFLKKGFPDKTFEIIHSGDVYGGKSKAELCKEFGISCMVEDNALYAIECAQNGIKVFLIDKPWNRDYKEHENLTKVNNWQEILEILK